MSKITFPTIRLGGSGLKISQVVMGTMSLGLKSWAEYCIEDEEQCFSLLKKCYDNGLRTFDTADMYSNGVSEEILGKFIKKYQIPRDKIVILSKCFFAVDQTPGFSLMNLNQFEYANSKGLSRKHIFDAVKASNDRLGTYMDVLQIHRLDKEVPDIEIMRALNDVVEAGYTRYIGASSMKTYQFANLQFIAEKNGWHKFVSMQSYYNLLFREDEREMNPFCKSTGVGLIPWSPNGRGVLARPFDSEKTQKQLFSEKNILRYLGLGTSVKESDKQIILRVEELAKKHGRSMMEIAIAWLISKGAAPIVGISTLEAIDDILKVADVKLSEEDVAYLEEPYEPKAQHHSVA